MKNLTAGVWSSRKLLYGEKQLALCAAEPAVLGEQCWLRKGAQPQQSPENFCGCELSSTPCPAQIHTRCGPQSTFSS